MTTLLSAARYAALSLTFACPNVHSAAITAKAILSSICSYVMHPYTMVKDHRTDMETGDVNKIMDGGLDEFIEAYLKKQAS